MAGGCPACSVCSPVFGPYVCCVMALLGGAVFFLGSTVLAAHSWNRRLIIPSAMRATMLGTVYVYFLSAYVLKDSQRLPGHPLFPEIFEHKAILRTTMIGLVGCILAGYFLCSAVIRVVSIFAMGHVVGGLVVALRVVTDARAAQLAHDMLANSDATLDSPSLAADDPTASTPILINNYQKLMTVRKMVNRFAAMGYRKIYILDNNSSYPPLLEYYQSAECRSKCEVIHLGQNYGYLAVWNSDDVRERFTHDWYIYTDPDLMVDSLPATFVRDFREIHRTVGKRVFEYRKTKGLLVVDPQPGNKQRSELMLKVGSALQIDDIPDFNLQKRAILKNERAWWSDPVIDAYLGEGFGAASQFVAQIDTTLALYPPGYMTHGFEGVRVAGAYTVRHQPWYDDARYPSREIEYYASHGRRMGDWGLGAVGPKGYALNTTSLVVRE